LLTPTQKEAVAQDRYSWLNAVVGDASHIPLVNTSVTPRALGNRGSDVYVVAYDPTATHMVVVGHDTSYSRGVLQPVPEQTGSGGFDAPQAPATSVSSRSVRFPSTVRVPTAVQVPAAGHDTEARFAGRSPVGMLVGSIVHCDVYVRMIGVPGVAVLVTPTKVQLPPAVQETPCKRSGPTPDGNSSPENLPAIDR
jgi:hypothetical protein